MSLTVETRKRVEEVYEMLLAGLRRAVILRRMRAKHGVAERTVDKYIALAKEQFEEDAKPRRQSELGKTLNRLETLYAKHMANGDYRGARQVEEVRIALLNLQTVFSDDEMAVVDEWLEALKGES